MNKFLVRVLLFFALVGIMDAAFSFFFSALRSHAKGGSTENCEYIASRARDSIIILGSSRATHHYIPQVIEDSLGVSCYNCGEEGNGIVLAYGRYLMLTNRYKPKLILYEVTPGYDYGAKDPNTKYLGYLRPYYRINGLKSIFKDFDKPYSNIKMCLAMYRNTGKLLPTIVDNIINRDNHRGYSPLYGRIEDAFSDRSEVGSLQIDSLKLSYMERLIVDAKNKGIPLVFIISPALGIDSKLDEYYPAISLCEKYRIPFYSFINYKSIADNPAFFHDILHMNNSGALAYTRLITQVVLKEFFCNNKGAIGESSISEPI